MLHSNMRPFSGDCNIRYMPYMEDMETMAKPTMFPERKLLLLRTETVKAIEAFRRERTPIPSESEAIRMILDDWLISHGYSAVSALDGHPDQPENTGR